MRVRRLVLRNFRNVEYAQFEPDPRINFLVGQNGQGKTSVLEALGFLATLRSFRDSKPGEVLGWGAADSEISCTAIEQEWETELRVAFHATDTNRSKVTKAAFINGKGYRSSTQYLSQRFGEFELGFHAIVFNPSDHDLVRGDPSGRRSYLDRVLSAEDPTYLEALQRYQRVLEQRNAVLRDGEMKTGARALLRGFSEPLARLAATLTRKRLEWLVRAGPRVNEAALRIAPKQPSLRLFYVSSWAPEIENLSICNKDLPPTHFAGQGGVPSLELLEQSFWKRLSSLESAEWRTGHTWVGPQRDDWALYLGTQPLRGHGSQGEVRSALLALKLAEVELFRNATKHRPLFLLDDFSSELDRERREFLLGFLSSTDLQVFVTTTERANVWTGAGKSFWVSNGSLTEVDRDRHDDAKSAAEHSFSQ